MQTNKILERDIESRLASSVQRLGGLCIKLPPLFHRGLPDRLVLLPGGRAFFIELKSPKGVQSPIQKRTMKLLQSMGFNVLLINSHAGVDDFIRTL